MAVDAKKHTSPAPGETPSRAQLAAMILSTNDAIPVANATERAQVVSALNAASVGPTATRPVLFMRGDAPGLHRLEYTYDGTAFVTASGTMTFPDLTTANSWAASNSALLSQNDIALIGGIEHTYTGTTWRPTRTFGLAVRNATALTIATGTYARYDANTYWVTNTGDGAAQGVTYNNGWVISTPGWYDVAFHFITNQTFIAGIQVNAASVASFTDLMAPATPNLVSGVAAAAGIGRIKLAANDVVQLWALAVSGAANIAASTKGQRFSISLVETS
ncbi:MULTISPECIES: hypothetical protein [unclassified Microbacterium]|uniref:hypothetical protein n=1 Tax=unclassified Microbacterium TaxID=2609290 RepID=UPI0030190785